MNCQTSSEILALEEKAKTNSVPKQFKKYKRKKSSEKRSKQLSTTPLNSGQPKRNMAAPIHRETAREKSCEFAD